MGVYSKRWLDVWSPYSSYGRSPAAAQGISSLVANVEKEKLAVKLLDMDGYFDIIDNYSGICKKMKANRADTKYHELEISMRANIEKKSAEFTGAIKTCIGACGNVRAAFKAASAAVTADVANKKLSDAAMRNLTIIEDALAKDLRDFGGNKLGIKLDSVRQSA